MKTNNDTSGQVKRILLMFEIISSVPPLYPRHNTIVPEERDGLAVPVNRGASQYLNRAKKGRRKSFK